MLFLISDCSRLSHFGFNNLSGCLFLLDHHNSHGAILKIERRGWVMFSENLIRGYVRLVAEGGGVRLALEHEPAPPPKALTVGSHRRGIDPAAPKRNYGSWGKGL